MNTTSISDAALAELIAYTNKTPGSKPKLAKLMSEAVGYEIQRQVVEGWMHKDPARRVEPKLGMGIMLLRVGGIMLGSRSPVNIGNIIRRAQKANGGPGNGMVVIHHAEPVPKPMRAISKKDRLALFNSGKGLDYEKGIFEQAREQMKPVESSPEPAAPAPKRKRKEKAAP